MPIRAAVTADLPLLQNIERAAGEAFRTIGMPEIADDEPLSPAELEAYRAGGRAWVHELDGEPVAYLLMDVLDGNFHIEQVTVHPHAAGRGLGRELIRHLGEAASAQGAPALTLTTFAEVPWNAPYYQRLGFSVMDDAGPELLKVRQNEAARGLDRWPRVCLIRHCALQ